MKEEDNSTVVDLTDNPKNAALHFDYVIPIHYAFYKEVADFKCTTLPIKDISNIYPKALSENIETFMDFWSTYVEFLYSETKETNTMPDVISDTEESWKELMFLIEKYTPPEIVVLYSNENLPDIYCGHCYNCSQIKLSQLPLIDTTKADWEQIIEIRKDKDSIKKLRKLKTFFHQNYSGKEKNFIQDDLLNRIEEYNSAVKDWGFETVISSLTLINTSVTSVGSSLVMALTGQPLEVAAATGFCVGVGNVALHLAQEKRKLMKLGRDHPLAYIIDTKKKLDKE